MVWCGYLGWLSLRDIRKRAIPLWMLSAGGLPVLLGLLRNGWNVSVITALLPGALILLLSVLTDTVGKADGIILMLLGSACTDGRIWLLLCLSLIYIFLYCFSPFYTAGTVFLDLSERRRIRHNNAAFRKAQYIRFFHGTYSLYLKF